MKRPIAIDLFAGAGGMSLGFEQAGFDIPYAIEYDPIHCATHQYNFPNTKVICESVADFRPYSLDQPDVVFGGPPCQGFSIGGDRCQEDPRNSLLYEFLRVVNKLQPRYFVVENVPGLLNNWEYLAGFINLATKAGYHIDYRKLNALNYGVSQNRDRIFFIGSREDQPLPQFPMPLTTIDPRSVLYPLTPSIGEVLAGLPVIEDYDYLYQQDWIEWEVLADNHYGYSRSYAQRLTGCGRTNHSPEVIARFANTLPGKKEPISRFRKLSSCGYCYTLRAGTGRERGSHTAPRPIHPDLPRCITVREGARLHSYPDWFCFHSTIAHGFRQVGNSVPPLLARAIASEIIKLLGVPRTKPQKILELSNNHLLNFTMTEACEYYNVPGDRIPKRQTKIA